MSVDFAPDGADQEGLVQPVPLILLNAESRLYQANFTVESNGVYTFTVSGIDLSGNVGNSSKSFSVDFFEEQLMAPSDFTLLPNYPNPFNPGTWIPYEIPQDSAVTIDIYSVAGQLIRSLKIGHRPAGSYTDKDTAAYWDGKDEAAQEMASGLYFCVLKAGQFTAIRKMILSK